MGVEFFLSLFLSHISVLVFLVSIFRVYKGDYV